VKPCIYPAQNLIQLDSKLWMIYDSKVEGIFYFMLFVIFIFLFPFSSIQSVQLFLINLIFLNLHSI
jgi:hypothetical protein